jgi:pimeloyl-ACP methyl ester carboxylesterase
VRTLLVLCIIFAVLLGLLVLKWKVQEETAGAATHPYCEFRKQFSYQDSSGARVCISYIDLGAKDACPLILLHGFGGLIYTWEEVAGILADDYRVIAVDLKGFGESDKPSDSNYSMLVQARIVDGLIRHLDLTDPVLIGHSMGGTISLILASDSQFETDYRIKALVIISAPAFRQRLPWFINLLRTPVIGPLSVHLVPPKTAVSCILKRVYYNDHLITKREIEAYARGLALPGGRAALVSTAKELAGANMQESLIKYDRINTPVSVIWGDKDEVVPLWVADSLATTLPGPVSIDTIPQCGHIPPTECPDLVVELLRHFLTQGVRSCN